jgi:hypothetical protein
VFFSFDDDKGVLTAVISAERRSRSRSKKEGSFCDMAGYYKVLVLLWAFESRRRSDHHAV